MRRQAVLLALLLVLIAGVGPAGAVTWGEPDTEHGNVGAILVPSPNGDGLIPFCSGTLVSPRVFLTAGHCTALMQTYGIDPSWIAVTFDVSALESPTLLDVDQIITHQGFKMRRASIPHDVGVLILTNPIAVIRPAELPEEAFLDQLKRDGKLRSDGEGVKFTVVGYGVTLDRPPPRKGIGGVRLSAQSEYLGLQKAWLLVSQNRATGNEGTCLGDSGGPAFWTQPDGSEILVGITSWGDDPCVATGFNYRIDTADALAFINAIIADLE